MIILLFARSFFWLFYLWFFHWLLKNLFIFLILFDLLRLCFLHYFWLLFLVVSLALKKLIYNFSFYIDFLWLFDCCFLAINKTSFLIFFHYLSFFIILFSSFHISPLFITQSLKTLNIYVSLFIILFSLFHFYFHFYLSFYFHYFISIYHSIFIISYLSSIHCTIT